MYNDLKENGRMQRGSKQNDKPLSNTFVRRVHAVLQAALKQAVKERLIPYNPCENCRIPPKDKKEMTILPPEKIGRYLQEAEKYSVLPMFYLELSSGLRRGELLALQWSDLNVKERILTVNKQVTRMEGELAENEKLCPQGGAVAAGGRPAGTGARAAPGQPHPVPVAPDRRLLESGRRVEDQPEAAEKRRHRRACALP